MKILALILLTPTLAFANASSATKCYSLPNLEKMNFCLAEETLQPLYCGYMRENDLKSMCRAKLSRRASYCSSIKSDDARAQCQEMAKAG